MGASTPVTRVVHYRHRTDTGAVDDAPSWAANEDTSASLTVGTNYRTRASVENTGTATDTITTPQFTRCGYAAGTFGTYANFINGADAGSSADAANITVQRLSNGTGSFASSTAGYDENESLSVTSTNGQFCEVEWGWVQTATQGVGGGETWTAVVQGLTNAPAVTITWTTPDTNGSDFQNGAQLGGAAQAVANSASISMTTSAAASSGNLVVVVVGCDNNSGTDGDNSEISSVTIDGNAATKAVEYTNGVGAAQAGATVSIWYRQLTGALGSGSTITANVANATTSGDNLTIQAREFVVAGGKTVAVEAINSAEASGTNTPPTIDATTSNIECLRIAAICVESATGNNATFERATDNAWSLWWVSGQIMYQTGALAQWVENTITTGTTDQSGMGSTGGGSNDWAAAYVAFRADAAGAGQPIVKRAGGVEFMHSLGRYMGKHIKVWFQGLMGGELAHG